MDNTTIVEFDMRYLAKIQRKNWESSVAALRFVKMRKKYSDFIQKCALPVIAIGFILGLSSYSPEEGMFPLNYLNGNDLKNAGLKLSSEEIFNPGKISLTDALVKVGGCTGSFISEDGLIITNHHCVYGGVSSLSTAENNYLENGFVAKTKSEELSINMPCKITQSYEDVSTRVLSGISENTSPEDRIKIIGTNIKAIVEKEKAVYPELAIEVSEMFVGRSYTLFRYIYLKDVRLVLAPPVTVGQFGGDSDNWEWPRHNGDFSLVRAYVDKNGKPAAYSKDNIPYKPKNTLKINPNGTKEGDFVFIMGYPGRTFRHESGDYLKFQQEIQLPTIQSWYKTYIDLMKSNSEGQVSKRLAFAGEIQSLENVEKNYRGKIQGLRRTDIVQKRNMQDDAILTAFPINSKEYKQANDVVPAIRDLWKTRTAIGRMYFYSNVFLNNQSSIGSLAGIISDYQMLAASALKNKNKTEYLRLVQEFKAKAMKEYSFIDKRLENQAYLVLINEIYREGNKLKINVKSADKVFGNSQGLLNKYVDEVSKSILLDTAKIGKLLREKPEKLLTSSDILVKIAKDISHFQDYSAELWINSNTKLNSLMPQYTGLREQFLKSQFIPDANSTLRLTYGYIRSYSPNDGETATPYTTLDGIFQKAQETGDYRLPKMVGDKLRKDNVPSIFKDPKTGKVIVGLLYNLDTTGGNSGSPVLNASGELIGINFDRSYTATINDYAWNEKYSRSIGCDIRYAIYVIKYVSEADHILKELNLDI